MFCCPVLLYAQEKSIEKSNKFDFNIGLDNQLPVQKAFKTFYTYGLGASVNVEYKAFKKLSVVLTPQYIRYFYSLGGGGSTGYLSIFIGAQYYLPYKIYVVGQAGFSEKILQNANEDAIAFTGGAGVYLTRKINADLKYEVINTSTTAPHVIDLRIGYTFGK